MTDSDPLRVVEIGSGLAGAVCGRLFAGLGHDVIRCEPPGGDALRRQPPREEDGEGLAWVALNADKSSVVVASDEAGRRAVRDLLRDADVAVISLPAAAAGELGLTPAGLRQDWPELVVTWITGFGLDGEYADLPGDSLLAEAYGGMATMIGEPGQRPLALGGEQVAYCSGVTGFLGAMLALRRRDAGLGGDIAEVAMCDVAAYMDWKSDLGLALTGRAPRRSGVDPGDWRLVRTSDGWVGCIFQAQHWESLVALVGAPELADPALKDEATRRARAAEWWPAVERWARERRAEEVYQLAQARGLPFGWVVRPSDLARSEQLLGRGFIRTARDAGGATPAVNSPVHADGLPWRSGRAPG
ncbi:MAG: CoA transferase, partial [Actinobacteria bacterium]|nr:CoA transferase [Actinomycetota bacterium]